MTTICVDVMGGDREPEVVLEGIAEALKQDTDLRVLAAGPEDLVVPFCASHERAEALVCTEAIAMDEHPADAVRAKKDSTIVRGCAAIRKGEADGFFSAGSTGAIFAAATLGVGRIKGIKRPAIAGALPGADGRRTVMLDLGANADIRPEMIVQFAQMGRAYARVVLGVENPKVGLLNNGSEETKGSELALSYHHALAEAGEWFAGNAEGGDLLAGTFDVIVADGFTGNVALKSLEGTAKYILREVKRLTKESKRAAIGALLLKPALKEVAKNLSGDELGGAILLGVKAPVLIGHGATSVDAVKNGTIATADAVRAGLVDKIAQTITEAND
jgi:glycerol-3-phosphate acyltransferase PlsX